MAQPVQINRKVTLSASNNQYLQYPVSGTMEVVEYAVDGSIIWGTFREDTPGACAVVVRNIQTLPAPQ